MVLTTGGVGLFENHKIIIPSCRGCYTKIINKQTNKFGMFKTATSVSNKLSFISDPGVSCIPLVAMELQQNCLLVSE